MHRSTRSSSLAAVLAMAVMLFALAPLALADSSPCGNVFVSGHDTDDHANGGATITNGQQASAYAFNQAAFAFTMNPACNPYVAAGGSKILVVESSMISSLLPGFSDPARLALGGYGGLINSLVGDASGFTGPFSGFTFVRAGVDTMDGTGHVTSDPSFLLSQLALLGQKGGYAGIIIASDFGGFLTQDDLNVLNGAGKSYIQNFISHGGGLIALSESGQGAPLTSDPSSYFGFLPCNVGDNPGWFAAGTAHEMNSSFTNSIPFMTTGTDGTAHSGVFAKPGDPTFTAGTAMTDVHNTFSNSCGLTALDGMIGGGYVTLAGNLDRLPDVPEPGSLFLMGSGLVGLGALRRRKRAGK